MKPSEKLVSAQPRGKILPTYRTRLGSMYCGNSHTLLQSKTLAKTRGKVQLVFTSPPFPLNTKKKYGNQQGESYIEWFANFAPVLKQMVTDDGSIVVEIGNSWEPGRPVMSTVVIRSLLHFLERGGLNLCQEFIWFNPAKLPSPVQWVNVERIRAKDAFTRIWWMSPSDRPKADNRRVLTAYSESMKRLIKTGHYNAGHRPSEHKIGRHSFKSNNNGAIAPSVLSTELDWLSGGILKATNTRSNDQYLTLCRKNGIQPHPARMPPELVEFFVRFLTEEGDLVLDPFAGSNTTGHIAESLKRRWLSCEENEAYALASSFRFDKGQLLKSSKKMKPSTQNQEASSASSVFTPVLTS